MPIFIPPPTPGNSLEIREYLLGLNLMPDPIIINEMEGIGLNAVISEVAVLESPGLDPNSEGYRAVRLGYNPYKSNMALNSTSDVYSTPIGNIGNEGHINIEYTDINTDINLLSETSRLELRKDVVKNQYVPDDLEVVDMGRVNPPGFTEQKSGYIDENQNLNISGPSTDAINVIGGFLTGDVGLNPNGSLATGFDIRSTILGRGLSATGVINDTPLGNIGAAELARAMKNNSLFGLEQELIGSINLNPLNAIAGGDIIIPNWGITVRTGALGKAADFFGRVSGLSLPRSLIKDGAIMWTPSLLNQKEYCNYEVDSIYSYDNTITNNLLIDNSGKGQVQQLFGLLNLNCYRPAYKSSRAKDVKNPLYYGAQTDNTDNIVTIGSDLFSRPPVDGIYQDQINSLEGEKRAKDGVNKYLSTNDIPDIKYLIWDADAVLSDGFNAIPNKGSILSKTQQLFSNRAKNDRLQTLLVKDNMTFNADDEISTPYEDMAGVPMNKLSKGSGVVNEDGVLCRTWSSLRRYNQIHNLQKNSGFYTEDENSSVLREGLHQSVMGDNWNGNGHPKIGPYMNDDVSGRVKRFMFSIENLAWADNIANLPPCELGPGDPISGDRGRIMWFPPYDLSFTDNTALSWESTPFIGRGEPVYTYNHTERSGTLSFSVIVDHPSQLNDLRWTDQKNEISTTMAGCKKPNIKDFTSTLTPQEVDMMKVRDNALLVKRYNHFQKNLVQSVKIYFPNDSADIPGYSGDEYSANTSSGSCGSYYESHNESDEMAALHKNRRLPALFGETYYNKNGGAKPNHVDSINKKDFGLNKDIGRGSGCTGTVQTIINKMIEKGPEGGYSFTITGHASKAASAAYNVELSEARIKYVLDTYFTSDIEKHYYTKDAKEKPVGESEAIAATNAVSDSRLVKEDRFVEINLMYQDPGEKVPEPGLTADFALRPNREYDVVRSGVYRECDYFIKMRQDNKFVFNDIRQQLRWFHPAFHSTTPEGLNSRLTFLQQCTRQGPTNVVKEDGSKVGDHDISNLQFGRPPICILRIGDFYHTKIVIDSVNISYDPLVLDLNPEGIGVQPMIAKVDMAFKFIGGSSLGGPISRLQNAVSFNFFANTGVYDDRADRIRIKSDGTGEILPGTLAEYNENKYELLRSEVLGAQGGVSTNEISLSELNQVVEMNNEAENSPPEATGRTKQNYIVYLFEGSSSSESTLGSTEEYPSVGKLMIRSSDGELYGGVYNIEVTDKKDRTWINERTSIDEGTKSYSLIVKDNMINPDRDKWKPKYAKIYFKGEKAGETNNQTVKLIKI